ncbi:MAG: glycoside hydrolase family 15 protein [Planctomycetota bacterium]
MPSVQHPQMQQFLLPRYRLQQVRDLISFLEEQGTFRFPTLQNGLFSASVAIAEEFGYTGYHHVWVRDNVHIAHAHLVIGLPAVAARTAQTLLGWFKLQQPRFAAIINGQADPQEPMLRPHIRFRGEELEDSLEKWSHAQNDALGYFLWLYCRLINEGVMEWDATAAEVLPLFPKYWQAIRYWEDADSGHWEETRKIEASSIGVAVAGLREFREVLETPSGDVQTQELLRRLIDDLLAKGQAALQAILPAECVQSDPTLNRRYDSALLFLIYPTKVVDGNMAEQIAQDVSQNLLGDYGIRRYLGDSYWCADYKTALAPEARTADFSDDLAARDKLLRPGLEAQWCIFDPILSIHYGLRYQQTRNPQDLEQQVLHVHRALGQLTGPDCPFGAFKCPESYYCERGQYVPNDVTPLLWTQANLRLALHFLEATADA